MNIINRITNRWLYLALICCSIAACKKNTDWVLPGDQQDIRVNYYMASDVLENADLNVDISLLHSDTPYQLHQTAFRLEGVHNFHVFPQPYQYSNGQQISYARYAAQPYHFVFSSGNTSLLDTLTELQPAAFHCLYLSDAKTTQGAPPLYRLLEVTEPRNSVPDGQIGVRFVNLSPETTSLNVQRLGSGTEVLSGLAFLHASEYSYFGSEEVSDGLLRFQLTDADGTIIFTGVPFKTGRTYTVLIQGFKTEQQRQVTATDGTSSIVTIPNNLRTVVRRTY